jgi:RimJ/RimL family protein N-acetyltransferase
MVQIPPAQTERLSIAALHPADAPELFTALDHPDVGRFIGGPEASSVDAMRERIERVNAGPPRTRSRDRAGERWWNFVVRAGADGRVLGRLEATTYGDWGEIAYVFDPRVWGAGYATEATTWLLQFLAGEGVVEVWAAVVPENQRSVRLLHRLGFIERDRPRDGLASYDDGDVAFSRSLAPVPHR